MNRKLDVQLFKDADDKLTAKNEKYNSIADSQQVGQLDSRQFWKGVNTALSNLQRVSAFQPAYQGPRQFNELLGGMLQSGNGGGGFGGGLLGLGLSQTQTDGFPMEHSSSGQPISQNADGDNTDTNCSKRRRLRTPIQQERNKLAQQRYRERCKSKHKEMEQTICRFNTRINELENENKRLRDNDTNLRKELHSLLMENKKLKESTSLYENSNKNNNTQNFSVNQQILQSQARVPIQENSDMQIQNDHPQDEPMEEEQELDKLLRLSHLMHTQIQSLVENQQNQKFQRASKTSQTLNLECQQHSIDLQHVNLVKQIENLIHCSKEYGFEDQVQALLQQGGDGLVTIVELLNQLQPILKGQDKKEGQESEQIQKEQEPQDAPEQENNHVDDHINILLSYLFENLSNKKSSMSREAFSEYCESQLDTQTLEFVECDGENMQIEWKHKRLQSAIRVILQLCTGGDGAQVSQLVCFVMDALCVKECEIKHQVYKLVRQETTEFYQKIKQKKAGVEDLQHVAKCIFSSVHQD